MPNMDPKICSDTTIDTYIPVTFLSDYLQMAEVQGDRDPENQAHVISEELEGNLEQAENLTDDLEEISEEKETEPQKKNNRGRPRKSAKFEEMTNEELVAALINRESEIAKLQKAKSAAQTKATKDRDLIKQLKTEKDDLQSEIDEYKKEGGKLKVANDTINTLQKDIDNMNEKSDRERWHLGR